MRLTLGILHGVSPSLLGVSRSNRELCCLSGYKVRDHLHNVGLRKAARLFLVEPIVSSAGLCKVGDHRPANVVQRPRRHGLSDARILAIGGNPLVQIRLGPRPAGEAPSAMPEQ